MSTAPAAPPSPAQHRTQFIRGVRDSMAKALAQGLGEPPAVPEPVASPTQVAAARSITGRLKQLIDKPVLDGTRRPQSRLAAALAPASPRGVSTTSLHAAPARGVNASTSTAMVPLAQKRAEVQVPVPLPKSVPRTVLTSPQSQQGMGKTLVVQSPVGRNWEQMQRPVKTAPVTFRVPQQSPTKVSAANFRASPRQVTAVRLPPTQGSPVKNRAVVTTLKPSPVKTSPVKSASFSVSQQTTSPFKISQESLKSMVNNINASVAAAGVGVTSPATATGLKPPPTNQKPIVRLSAEPSAADTPSRDLANGNAEVSEERKRMIALAQLKILQRKSVVVSPQQVCDVELTAPEMSAVKNGHMSSGGAVHAESSAEVMTPDVEDANRCASGLLVRKTYMKVPRQDGQGMTMPLVSQSPLSGLGGFMQKRRGRPRRQAAAVGPERPALQPALPVDSEQLSVDVSSGAVEVRSVSAVPEVVPQPPAVDTLARVSTTANGSSQTSPDSAAAAAGGGDAAITRKRRHETPVERDSSGTSCGSPASSGRSSATESNPPAAKKSKPREVSRMLANLSIDEGAINIMSEMSRRGADKRRARSDDDKVVHRVTRDMRKKEDRATKYGAKSTRVVVSSRAGLKARTKLSSPAAKIKAKALLVKKKPTVVRQSKKQSPSKVKLKAQLLKVKLNAKKSVKVVGKTGGKLAKSGGSKSGGQSSAAKANQGKTAKAVSPSGGAVAKKVSKSTPVEPKQGVSATDSGAKKGAKSTVAQSKPKKTSANAKPDSSSGKKSPPASISNATAAKSGTSQEKIKTQPKPAPDKNLNNNEKKEKSKEIKPGSRNKDSIGEDRGTAVTASSSAGEAKSGSPPSKSSKASTPPPEPLQEPASPGSLTYGSLQRRLELATLKQARRRGVPEDRERSSSRSNLGTVRHREICVKKFARFHQVVLCPVTTRLRAGLNVQVMREVREYLAACARDPACRAVLLTSSAGPFCQGLDYSSLMGLSPEKRRRAAEELANELKEFIRAVAGFSKPLLAGVTGSCVGLGVGLLPLCDLVYVSEKATLQTFYSRLGTVPEGGATHSLTVLLGHMKAGSLLMTGRALTGSEAYQLNLATGLLWSATAYEDLIAQARDVLDNAAQVQSLESTKALIRHSLRAKMEMALHSECRLLVHQWSAPEFQQRAKELYDSGLLQLQKAGFDTQ